jgi:hypothetical protein
MLNRVISKRQPRTIQDTRLFLAPGDHSIRNDLANESAVKGSEEEATIRPSCDTSCPVGPELQVRLVLGQGSTAKQGATTAQEGDRPRPAFLLAKAATVASLHGAPLGRNRLSATVITTAPVSELAAGAANSAMSFWGPKTSIGNNVQRAGNNSPPRSRRRIGLELGLVRGTAHTFFARFQSPSARGGRHSMSTASSG